VKAIIQQTAGMSCEWADGERNEINRMNHRLVWANKHTWAGIFGRNDIEDREEISL